MIFKRHIANAFDFYFIFANLLNEKSRDFNLLNFYFFKQAFVCVSSCFIK